MKDKIINFPNGYPYILYKVETSKKYKYIVAATEQQAIRNSELQKAKALPLSVNVAIKTLGHNETNQLLSQFGKSWICKESKVFYKSVPL